MSFLQEFSKIVILKDTQATREAFGFPIVENDIKTANIFALDNTNPFYSRLVNSPNSTIQGWREYYPNIDASLGTGPDTDDNVLGIASKAIRGNFLQVMTTVEENITNGYNKSPQSAGTAIIIGDKLYIGSTSKKTYTAISTGATEVTVTGTGFTGIAVGSKIILSAIGTTNLSTSTTYYAYAVNPTTLKLASSLAFANSATAITTATGSFSGSADLTVAASGSTYTQYTDFTVPSPLAEGDYIFWGDDPNDLKIGGKIKTVLTSGSDYNAGARYEFYKPTEKATPTDGGLPVPQNIYYYRKGWNGKDVKNVPQNSSSDKGGGFYVLIKAAGTTTNVVYPYLGTDAALTANPALDTQNNPIDRIVEGGTLYAFTDLIRIRRISNEYAADETDSSFSAGQIIPCSIHRTSNFYYEGPTVNNPNTVDWQNNKLVSLYRGTAPGFYSLWTAYYINPYGGDAGTLAKNTTYVIEINERLPAANFSDGVNLYNFAKSGAI